MGLSIRCNLSMSFVKEGEKEICRRKIIMNKIIEERLMLCRNIIKFEMRVFINIFMYILFIFLRILGFLS